MSSNFYITLKIILYCIISIMNIGSLIKVFFIFNWKMFFYLTIINTFIITIYLISSVYIDIMTHFVEKTVPTLSFWRDYYFKFAFIISQVVFLGYWSLCLLGKNFMPLGGTTELIIFMIYIHGVVCEIMVLDVFISNHNYIENTIIDVIIISIVMATYILMQLISKYFLDFNVYPYLKLFSSIQLIIFYLLSYMISLNLYQLYISLIKCKNGNKRKNLDFDNCYLRSIIQ